MSFICLNFRTGESMSHYRICIGYPGVGKSTLINCLEGEVLFKSGGNDGKVLKHDLQVEGGSKITYLEIPVENYKKQIKKAAKTMREVVQKNVCYQIFFVVKSTSRHIREQLEVIQLVLKSAGNITLYNLIINKLSTTRCKAFSKNDNLRLVFEDLNNMQPAFSLLLQQEDFLYQAEDKFMRLKKLDNFVAKVPYGNAFSDRDGDYSGNYIIIFCLILFFLSYFL